MPKSWSCGHKGVSRVTIRERPDGTSLYVEWYDDDGRHKRALSTVIGHPVTDWDLAKEIAKRMSAAQERKRNLQAAEALGITKTAHTLADLFERRHADLSPDWSGKYAKSRERRRKFWLDKLGPIALSKANAALVEKIARDAQAERKLSDRWRQDVLRYIVDSYAYAERKLKWIEPRHNLSAVTIPKAHGKSKAYTLEEARKLLPKLWKVDERAGWMGEVAMQTGRRIGAIRKLRAEDVEADGEWTQITFPGETDKARKTGVALVKDLPERTDWRRPTPELVNDWLHEAEKLAGIEHVDGRAFHGLKRLYATLTAGMMGADLQSGTLRSTLDAHYRQDTLDPKREVAERLAETVGGG